MNDKRLIELILFCIVIFTFFGMGLLLSRFVENYFISFIVVSWLLCFVFLRTYSVDVAKLSYLIAIFVSIFLAIRMHTIFYPLLTGALILITSLFYMYRIN